MIDPKRILYGKPDSIPIVSIDTVNGSIDTLAIYYKDGDKTKVVHRASPYFIYTDFEQLGRLMDEGRDIPYTVCSGTNPLNVLLKPERYDHFKWLKSYLPSNIVTVSGPQGFMVEHEVNMFSGLDFDDVSRFYFDIEQITTGHFPDAENPDDHVVIISCLYTYKNKTSEYLLKLDDYKDEAGLLEAFVKLVRLCDPDIILHYNGFRYDLPVLQARCKLFNVKFGIGRDGSEPYSFSTQIKFAEKETAYTNFNIHGRSCIDVYFLVMYYDVVKRELPAHGLKEAAKHFGVAAEHRVYIDGKEITNYWHNNRTELLKYAMDDVIETRALDKILGQSVFYSTHFTPLLHQDIARYGTGTKIDAIFTRAYIKNEEAYPLADPKRDFDGGYAGCPARGYIDGPMMYADVKSLYPTLAAILNIQPPKDTLGVYAPALELIKQERFRSKELADRYEAEGNPLYEAENAKQNAVKIMINTLSFGWLGWEYGAFNDYDSAEAITTNGQKLLKKMNEEAVNWGGEILKFDTDGTLLKYDSWEQTDELLKHLNTSVREFVAQEYGKDKAELFQITNDGTYEKGIIFDRKSYVLVNRKGKVTVKGNTLKSRSMEPFVKSTLYDMVMNVMDRNLVGMVERYDSEVARVKSGLLTFAEIRKRANLKMGKDEYLHKREAGRTHAIAAYEIAYTQEHDIPFRKGDPLEFYVKEAGSEFVLYQNWNWKLRKIKRTVAELATVAKYFNADYDEDYYLDRLNQGVKRLLPIFGINEFSSYFPSIKLTKQDTVKLEKHGTDDMDSEENDISE
jgi:DNA polymerase, archaea type